MSSFSHHPFKRHLSDQSLKGIFLPVQECLFTVSVHRLAPIQQLRSANPAHIALNMLSRFLEKATGRAGSKMLSSDGNSMKNRWGDSIGCHRYCTLRYRFIVPDNSSCHLRPSIVLTLQTAVLDYKCQDVYSINRRSLISGSRYERRHILALFPDIFEEGNLIMSGIIRL